MKARRSPALYGMLIMCACVGLQGQSPKQHGQIIIGPNILVSRDGDIAHCETMIAANPRDPKNLLGGSIVMTDAEGSFTTKPYTSFDGGATWNVTSLPMDGGADPQVGFGMTGTAYFVGLKIDSMSDSMMFFRSEDGGRTWSKGLNLGKNHDHEMLVTDYTYGRYAGRVYMTDEVGVPGSKEMEDMRMRRRLVLFRSSDDGRSFVGPVEVARSDDNGMGPANILVLSDGTLFIPIIEYPNYSTDKTTTTWNLVYSLSRDGGVTFSPLQSIAKIPFGGITAFRAAFKTGQVDQMASPVFAVDRQGKFHDRIYAAWTELEGNRYRLMLTWSSDFGKTWAKPKPVDPNAPAYASQYQPMIAVDPNGNVGILFYDTDGFPKRDHFAVSFAGSTDGGETLLPKRRLSSEISDPFGSGDLRPGSYVMTDAARGLVTADFVSAASRWVHGGDYIGLTASEDGVFHPFWTDARSGTYQLYTAPVRVLSAAESSADENSKLQKVTQGKPISLSTKVTLVIDPVTYDRQTMEAVVPISLKNISDQTLYPPFQVEVKELAHPFRVKSGSAEDPPTILNATNGKTGVGAVFDYTRTLGDLPVLEPGAVTSAIPWRLQAPSPVKTDFHLGVEITGYTQKQP